jgi:hypothetical protein
MFWHKKVNNIIPEKITIEVKLDNNLNEIAS